MKTANVVDANDNIIEEIIETEIRGQTIRLTAESLNNWLGITEVPTLPAKHLSDAEIFSVLKPGEPLGPLNFTPASMNDTFRVLWYIYSRNLVQKGKNFSHFTFRDYPLFASIVSKEPRSLGEWIMDEINHFRFHSNVTSSIPFPNLVSYILSLHNVWHLTSEDQYVKPQRFGKSHLSRMKISFTELSSQSKLPKKSVPSSPLAEEAQSSQAGSPTASAPSPSFFGPSIQPWVKDALQGVVQQILESNNSLKASHESLLLTFDSKMKILVAHMNENFKRLFELQDAHTAQLQEMKSFLLTLGFSPAEPPPSTSGPSSSVPVDPSPPPEPVTVAPPPAPPSSDPASSTIPQDPLPSPSPTLPISSDSSTQPAPTLKPPTSSSSSSSTATAPPSIDPSSAMIIYTPPPSFDLTFPTFLPDDKGGES